MGNVDPAVVPGDEMEWVGGIDPERMVVRVDAGADGFTFLATVGRDIKSGRLNIDDFVVRGVDAEMAVIKRAGVNAAVGFGVAHPLPAFPAVLRPPEASILVLDQGVDNSGQTAGHGDPDPSQDAFGEVLGQPRPGLSTIDSLIKATSRTAARKGVRQPAAVIRG